MVAHDLSAPPAGDAWDEATLVTRAQDGDPAAFEILVERYQAPLFRHAFRLLGDRGSAEDVVQEALVVVWRRLPTLGEPRAFRSWAYQVTTRRCLDLLRVRRPTQPLDEDAEPGRSRVPAPAAARDEPAQLTEHEAQLAALQQALRELPAPQQAVWAMREIDGLSYDEIASALALPVSTVRGRIARARTDLAERMTPWR